MEVMTASSWLVAVRRCHAYFFLTTEDRIVFMSCVSFSVDASGQNVCFGGSTETGFRFVNVALVGQFFYGKYP